MNEEIVQKNKRLLEVHDYWYKNIAEPVIEKYADVKFSLPFYVGLSNMNTTNMPVAMIVGQETRDFHELNEENLNKWSPEESQKWSIDCFNTKLGFCASHYNISKKIHPFWQFFRYLYNNGVFPCWNNLDKFHRYIINEPYINGKSKTKSLEVGHEKEFNKTIHQTRTLLLKEIEIVKPDVIIFVTGPNYITSMETALMCNQLSSTVPNLNHFLRDITKIINVGIPAYWTYHPGFLTRRRIIKNCIEELLCRINESLH